MSRNANYIAESWLSRTNGYDSSGWLSAFAEAPKKAVVDLLADSFYFGPLNLTERGQLLEGWLDLLGNSESFAEDLDAEFTNWIEENWGRYNGLAESLVSVWSSLCSVIEFSAKLPVDSQLKNSAAALRLRFPQRQEFLGSFSTAPSADPLGIYLAVIAEFQTDRSLATFWHHMCDLPDGIPFYHAPYALLGLRRLGAADPVENGTLRAEVVLGLLRLARSFQRLVRTRGLDAHIAKSTYQRLAAQTAAAYPDSPGWVAHGLTALLELEEPAQKWVIEAVTPLGEAIRRQKNDKTNRGDRSHQSLQPNPNWPRRVRELVARLRSADRKCLDEVRQLLDEQRRYTEATGDTYYIVRTLSNFARRVRRLNSQLALRWAEEARKLDPNDPYTWSTLTTLLLQQERLTEALSLAWVAWKRFPEDSVSTRLLAEVLKAARRYDEAGAIYLEARERFPDTEVRGLAEVLKAAHRYGEAEALYRDAIEQSSEDIKSRNGLADTLRRMGHNHDAEAEYRQSIKSGYVDPATFVGLAYLVLGKGEAGRIEATELVGRALELDPNNYYALSLKRELTAGGGTNLDDLMDEWDKVADSLFNALTLPTYVEMEGVDEREAEEVVTFEQPRSSTDQAATAIGNHSEDSKEDVRDLGSLTINHTEKSRHLIEGHVKDEKESAAVNREVKSPPFRASQPVTVAALVAEAYFYRVWAKDTDNKLAQMRRGRAAELLIRAEQLSPYDPKVLTEKIALSIDQGNKVAGYQRLVAELSSHPATTSLLVLKARLDRERAREENRRMNEATLSELCVFPQRLRDLDPTLTPLFHYQKGLAALALLDGDERKQAAADAFSRFRQTLARRAVAEHNYREATGREHERLAPTFYEWLQEQVNRQVFAGVCESGDLDIRRDHIAVFEALWEQRRPIIEGIEDVFADYLTFRTI